MIAVTSVAPTSDWREHALCRGVDPSVFHPADEEENEFSAEPAKTICFQCPVREACLEHAIAVPREARGLGWSHRPRAASPDPPPPSRVLTAHLPIPERKSGPA